MQPDHRARYTFGFALLAALLAALILWNLNTGSLHLSPAEVMDILLTRTGENAAIVWEMRLPRLIAAMLLGGALMSTIGAKLIRNNMRVVAFGIALVGVSVVGLGVVHNLLAYLLIDVVNGLASAICTGPMRTIIQTEADERMVGRVFGLDTTLSALGMPLGMLIFAPLADVIPISLVFIIGGVLTLPIGIYLFGQARRNVSAQVTRTAA